MSKALLEFKKSERRLTDEQLDKLKTSVDAEFQRRELVANNEKKLLEDAE